MAGEITFETTLVQDPDLSPDVGAVEVPSVDAERWFGRKGRTPIVATINGYAWRTTLMPMGGCHMFVVNAEARAGSGVKGGDRVTVSIREDREPRTVDVPDDLAAALDAAGMRAVFDAMSYTHRKEWARAVNDAKRPPTREKRIADCVAAMRER